GRLGLWRGLRLGSRFDRADLEAAKAQARRKRQSGQGELTSGRERGDDVAHLNLQKSLDMNRDGTLVEEQEPAGTERPARDRTRPDRLATSRRRRPTHPAQRRRPQRPRRGATRARDGRRASSRTDERWTKRGTISGRACPSHPDEPGAPARAPRRL